MRNSQTANEITRSGEEIEENDVELIALEVEPIRFTPTFYSPSLNQRVKYKQFQISYESLSPELQKQLQGLCQSQINSLLQQAKKNRKRRTL